MISAAFPSLYETREHFYGSYHDHAGAITISRFSTSVENPNVADPSSERLIMSLPNPYAARIGGQISFGRDGYLYVALGAPDPLFAFSAFFAANPVFMSSCENCSSCSLFSSW
jgi:glucose/arabinose dehydrogenase